MAESESNVNPAPASDGGAQPPANAEGGDKGDLLDAQGQQQQPAQGAQGNGQQAAQNAGEGQPPKGDGEGRQEDGDLLDPVARQKEIDDEQNKVPEKYESFKVPDGFTLDDARFQEASGVFRDLGLSQSKAQALVDYFCKLQEANSASQRDALAKQVSAWRSEVRGRPEYEDERVAAVRGMRAVVKTPEEIALFKDSGLANHPAMWSMMVKVGRLVGEDGIGRGGGSAPAGEERFHVNMDTL